MARCRAALELSQAESALTQSPGAVESLARNKERRPQQWVAVASGGGALLLFLMIYLPRLDRVVGLVVDDGLYVMLAKALATRQGYMLVNSPSSGILPLYPPLFPWLLSLAYRLAPQFPDNVWLLKSVSI